MSLPGYDAWLEKPYTDAEHDCPDEPDECRCVERDEDGRDSALVDRDDADHGR
jgi:hypothetical protein